MDKEKAFICGRFVFKFKGTRLVFMSKCVKCKGVIPLNVQTHTHVHADKHTNKLWLSLVIKQS